MAQPIKSIYLIQIALFTLLVIILFSILMLLGNKVGEAVTQIQCCNNQTCSDTYYISEDNMCHLVLCEQSIFTNKKDCIYSGLNVSIDLIN